MVAPQPGAASGKERLNLKERLTWELFLGRQGNLHESMVHDSQLSNSGSEAETFTGEKN